MEKLKGVLSFYCLLLILLILPISLLQAQVVQVEQEQALDVDVDKVFVESIIYDDNIYSDSRKTEIGERMSFGSAFRYQHSENTFIRTRFRTRPEEDRGINDTSDLELLFNHQYRRIFFRMDIEVDTDAGSTGGTRIGFDTQSADTFLSWMATDSLTLSFYPFNFNGRVGSMFDTWHINRFYNIINSPTNVDPTNPNPEDQLVAKTIPGLEAQYTFKNGLSVYTGFGAASYLYPAAPGFDIVTNQTADRWERKLVFGGKAGLFYRDPATTRFRLQYVGQNNTDQTGALLEQGASFNTITRLGRFLLQAEVTGTKAGRKPWQLNNTGRWFDGFNNQAIYLDRALNQQDWIGKTDFAYGLKLGLELKNITPFVSAEYLGEHFVFNDIKGESAHQLRTNDERLSHGGLWKMGMGAHFYIGRYMLVPEITYRSARNAVFTNSDDLRENRELASFQKNDVVASLQIVYSLNDWLFFKP